MDKGGKAAATAKPSAAAGADVPPPGAPVTSAKPAPASGQEGEEGWLSAKSAGGWASGGKVAGGTGGAAKTAVKTGAAAGVTTAVEGQVRRGNVTLPRKN